MRIFRCLVLSLAAINGSSIASAGQAKRPFTVADDIAVTQFDIGSDPLRFSPDGKYFVVWSERGRLDLNSVEDSLRFYRTEDIQAFLNIEGS
jgi:hypothetical protein